MWFPPDLIAFSAWSWVRRRQLLGRGEAPGRKAHRPPRVDQLGRPEAGVPPLAEVVLRGHQEPVPRQERQEWQERQERSPESQPQPLWLRAWLR